MLIRSNNLNESDGILRSRSFNDPLNTLPMNSMNTLSATTATTTANSATNKAPQNRYEALFIKLFAQTTLQLILSFTAMLLSIIIIRDLIGLRINILKLSFWFQFILNLSLFIALIFAKMKCISNIKNNHLSNPFEYFFNQDQLILIGIWTAAAFNFGSWYFRQYAPHIYKLFDHAKGKHSMTPVLREQYFLIWATLLSHGIVSWTISMYFSVKPSIRPNNYKISLYNFLKSRIQDVTFLPSLLNRSAMIYFTLILIHFTCSWIAFPMFGLFLSALIDINQPIRHSWSSIFRIGLFVHSLTFSIISNLIFSLIDWLIEFYLGRTFNTSALVSDSEHLLTIGLCETKQSFINLQACNEFLEISNESNSFRRYKIFSAVSDEGSLSREILDWFSNEIEEVKRRCEQSIQELNSLNSILGNNNNNIELPNPELFKQYREKTISLVEIILKKVFSVEKEEKSTKPAEPSQNITGTSAAGGLPEIFARRGPTLNLVEQSTNSVKKEAIPLIFEFGPILNKNSIGKLLISKWLESRKFYPIENFEILKISIKAVGSFISASFIEDESGQVQMALPRVLETSVNTLKTLQNLLETNFEASEADEQIETVLDLLKEMLKGISETFGETLENVRISTECREFIKNQNIQ